MCFFYLSKLNMLAFNQLLHNANCILVKQRQSSVHSSSAAATSSSGFRFTSVDSSYPIRLLLDDIVDSKEPISASRMHALLIASSPRITIAKTSATD